MISSLLVRNNGIQVAVKISLKAEGVKKLFTTKLTREKPKPVAAQNMCHANSFS